GSARVVLNWVGSRQDGMRGRRLVWSHRPGAVSTSVVLLRDDAKLGTTASGRGRRADADVHLQEEALGALQFQCGRRVACEFSTFQLTNAVLGSITNPPWIVAHNCTPACSTASTH